MFVTRTRTYPSCYSLHFTRHCDRINADQVYHESSGERAHYRTGHGTA
jgi:hypothetical protein